jgi:protocatechuate 3,4-dioxygenase beta subunit
LGGTSLIGTLCTRPKAEVTFTYAAGRMSGMNEEIRESRLAVSRRRAMGLGGSVGLGALLAACTGGNGEGTLSPGATPSAPVTVPTTNGTATVQPGTTAAADVVALLDRANSCGMMREQTQGPFWFDVDSIRSDIREDRPGTPLQLALRVWDQDCRPLPNSVVEIWHCDAGGAYSGFEVSSGGGPRGGARSTSDGSYTQGEPQAVPADDGTYLRGAQVADANGIVQFTTVYPGWYSGRTVHIHLKVHVNKDTVLTSQVYFEEELNDEVLAAAPYNSRSGRDTLNEDDGIFDPSGLLTAQPVQDGYLAGINLGVEV